MGADLILAWLVMPAEKEPDWDAAKKHVTGLGPDELGELGEMHFTDEAAKEQAILLLDQVREVWEAQDRYSERRRLGEIEVLVAGGTSWGESPSEAFDAISELSNCPGVLDAAGFLDETAFTGIKIQL